MYEKISEAHIREEKIKKLQAKILAEIEEKTALNKRLLLSLPDDMNDNQLAFWNEKIREEYYMQELKSYIEDARDFYRFEVKDYNTDCVVYTIPIENIEKWLNEDNRFRLDFCFRMEQESYSAFYHNDSLSFSDSDNVNIH